MRTQDLDGPIPKLATLIEGFDLIASGGLPTGRREEVTPVHPTPNTNAPRAAGGSCRKPACHRSLAAR